jgi:hypothetical protein
MYAFRPRLPFDALTSLSVIPSRRMDEVWFQKEPITLLNSWQNRIGDGFFEDSFGFYSMSFGRSFPSPGLLTLMRSVNLSSRHISEDTRMHKPEGQVFVTDELALLKKIAQSNALYGLAQLSAFSSPRLEIRKRHWSEAFTIIVGDSFDDRLTFWNSRFFAPAWLHMLPAHCGSPAHALRTMTLWLDWPSF